jgi:hypothetical protein
MSFVPQAERQPQSGCTTSDDGKFRTLDIPHSLLFYRHIPSPFILQVSSPPSRTPRSLTLLVVSSQ